MTQLPEQRPHQTQQQLHLIHRPHLTQQQTHVTHRPHQTQKHIMSGHIFRSSHAPQACVHTHIQRAATVGDGLPSVVKFLKDIAQKGQWPAKAAFNTNMVVEELLINTLTHGNQGRDSPIDFEIAVATDAATGIATSKNDQATCDDGQATYGNEATHDGDHTINITISDNGAPFNPIKDAPLADTTSPLEHREVGGLGLVFVTHMMKNPTYRYSHGRNQLTFAILTHTDTTETSTNNTSTNNTDATTGNNTTA